MVDQKIEITGIVEEIRGNRARNLSELARITVGYESSNILGSITLDVPFLLARNYYVGQELKIILEPNAD